MAGGLSEFQKVVLAELERGIRLKLAAGTELDPQFRLATPEGDYAVAVTLPNDPAGRAEMFAYLADLFRWKQVGAFTMVAEAVSLRGVIASGVRYGETACAVAPLLAEDAVSPESYGAVSWFGAEAVGNDIISLLPSGRAEMTADEVRKLEEMFGRKGRFPLEGVMRG